jgi:hypothetical protein
MRRYVGQVGFGHFNITYACRLWNTYLARDKLNDCKRLHMRIHTSLYFLHIPVLSDRLVCLFEAHTDNMGSYISWLLYQIICKRMSVGCLSYIRWGDSTQTKSSLSYSSKPPSPQSPPKKTCIPALNSRAPKSHEQKCLIQERKFSKICLPGNEPVSTIANLTLLPSPPPPKPPITQTPNPMFPPKTPRTPTSFATRPAITMPST